MQQIDPKTLTNVVVMENREFDILMANIETLNDDMLTIMPTYDEQTAAKLAYDLIHVIDDVYLARGEVGGLILTARSCTACAMNSHRCEMLDGARKIPCIPNATVGFEGYTAIRAQDQTVAMPTNGKKGKKEYVPDTAASFDFSEQNWKSVRSMIGM
jgi:hypothetical protein